MIFKLEGNSLLTGISVSLFTLYCFITYSWWVFVFWLLQTQRESVDKIENQVEQSHAHVFSAQKELAQVASKMQGTVYPLLGAIIGSCVAGPIGLVAGLKVGAVVAVTGSVIGKYHKFIISNLAMFDCETSMVQISNSLFVSVTYEEYTWAISK